MRRVGSIATTVVLGFVLTASLLAGETISPEQASKYVGKVASVRGVVSGVFVSRSETTFINFGKPYPDQPFTAVIFRSSSPRFPNASRWEGKMITVTGAVRLYKGKPEIVLESPSQVSE